MKIKSLILAMAACAGLFTACTNELATDENGNGLNSEKNAYASFSFVMPNAGGSTRADNPDGSTTGDGGEVGTQDENEVTNVSILLFQSNNLVQVEDLKRSDFSPTVDGNSTVYRTLEAINVSAGVYNVQVVVNPTTAFKKVYNKDVKSGSYTDYLKVVEQVAPKTGEYCTDRNFMMTNADVVAATTTEVKEENVAGHAKEISVNVERIAAKITFEPNQNNTYDINDDNATTTTKIGTVTFDAYKVINTRNSAFNQRRVGMDLAAAVAGAKENGSNYVIENEWASKSAWNADFFASNYSRRGVDTYVAFRNLDTKRQTLAYCLENTMPQANQIEGYTTTVVLRAKVSLDAGKVTMLNNEGKLAQNDKASEGTLYKYTGKFYGSRAAIVKAENPDWDLSSLKGLNTNTLGLKNALTKLEEIEDTSADDYLQGISAADLNDIYGTEYYASGNCYYKVLLRHANNNLPTESGIMEFAIVRNNVYKLSIESVKFLGSFSSGTKGPKDPSNPSDGQEDVTEGGNNPEIPGKVVEPDTDTEPETPVITPKPTDPDEKDAETFLNVTIKVLGWTVRNNGVIL